MDVDDDQEDEEDAEYLRYLAMLEGGNHKDAAARSAKRRRQRYELPIASPTSLAEDVPTPVATPTKRRHGMDAATPGTPFPSPTASAATSAVEGLGVCELYNHKHSFCDALGFPS